MKWSVSFQGGEELARQLNKLAFAVTRQVLLAALRAGAEPMRVRASLLAPRSPVLDFYGHMQDNIIIQSVNRVGSVDGGRWESRLGEAWVAVGPAKPFFYGLFQEYGTKFAGAQPFMRPAFDAGAPEALPIISDHLWSALRKAIPGSFATGSSVGRFDEERLAA